MEIFCDTICEYDMLHHSDERTSNPLRFSIFLRRKKFVPGVRCVNPADHGTNLSYRGDADGKMNGP